MISRRKEEWIQKVADVTLSEEEQRSVLNPNQHWSSFQGYIGRLMRHWGHHGWALPVGLALLFIVQLKLDPTIVKYDITDSPSPHPTAQSHSRCSSYFHLFTLLYLYYSQKVKEHFVKHTQIKNNTNDCSEF